MSEIELLKLLSYSTHIENGAIEKKNVIAKETPTPHKMKNYLNNAITQCIYSALAHAPGWPNS